VALETAPVVCFVEAACCGAAPDDFVLFLEPGDARFAAPGEALFVGPVHWSGEEDLVVCGEFGAAEEGGEDAGFGDGDGADEHAVQGLEVGLVAEIGGEGIVGDVAFVEMGRGVGHGYRRGVLEVGNLSSFTCRAV
jgi:hypothetical protein